VAAVACGDAAEADVGATEPPALQPIVVGRNELVEAFAIDARVPTPGIVILSRT
jgi:hypothetical protein